MIEIEIPIPGEGASVGGPNLEESILKAATHLGLAVSLDGTLRSVPGSRHWHLRRGNESGTLEVTWSPRDSRAWVSYRANRVGSGWVEEAAAGLAKTAARLLDVETG